MGIARVIEMNNHIIICCCGAVESIYLPTRRCVECRQVDKYMYHCVNCMGCVNEEVCPHCEEIDRLDRVKKDVHDLCEPIERITLPERTPTAVKHTRFPDRFNPKGKKRVTHADKYAPNKYSTKNKKKDRTLLRRIKNGYDEPVDCRIGNGLTIHDDVKDSYSWKSIFGVRSLNKLERENALRIAGNRPFTYGCACLRQAWKVDHPRLVAGSSFREDTCPGCADPKIQGRFVKQILERYNDDFSHDDCFYLVNV